MALGCLERKRRLYKELLQKDIVHGEKLLSESYKIIDLDKFSIRLNQCIRLLKINSDNLELTHENISLAATKDNEKDIMTQIKNDFDILDSAVDVRMELEDCEKETQDKIEELKISAKLSALSKDMDTLLLATEQQMEMVSTNHLRIKELNREYPAQLSQWKEKLFDVKEIASNCAYSLAGEGADGSIVKTTDKVIEPGVKVSKFFHKRSLFTNYERTTDQQKEIPVQTYAVKQKDPMAEEVSSKEAPKNRKGKKQRQKTKLKHRTNISAVSKRHMKTKKWRKSPILGKQRYKTRNCRKRKQCLLKDKQRMKRRNPRRKRKQLDKRSNQIASEVKKRIPTLARVWLTKTRRKCLVYGKHVYPKRKTHDKKKKGKDEETKGNKITHGTKERRSKYSRGRIKLKVSKHWTKQKCHSAGQRILDDDDDDDDDDDLKSVSKVAW